MAVDAASSDGQLGRLFSRSGEELTPRVGEFVEADVPRHNPAGRVVATGQEFNLSKGQHAANPPVVRRMPTRAIEARLHLGLLTLARNAEAEGVEYLAVHDHLEPYCRDVFVNMTYPLSNTESAIVGTNVVNP